MSLFLPWANNNNGPHKGWAGVGSIQLSGWATQPSAPTSSLLPSSSSSNPPPGPGFTHYLFFLLPRLPLSCHCPIGVCLPGSAGKGHVHSSTRGTRLGLGWGRLAGSVINQGVGLGCCPVQLNHTQWQAGLSVAPGNCWVKRPGLGRLGWAGHWVGAHNARWELGQ